MKILRRKSVIQDETSSRWQVFVSLVPLSRFDGEENPFATNTLQSLHNSSVASSILSFRLVGKWSRNFIVRVFPDPLSISILFSRTLEDWLTIVAKGFWKGNVDLSSQRFQFCRCIINKENIVNLLIYDLWYLKLIGNNKFSSFILDVI